MRLRLSQAGRAVAEVPMAMDPQTVGLYAADVVLPAQPGSYALRVRHVRPGETRLSTTATELEVRPAPRGGWSVSSPASAAAALCSVLGAAGTLVIHALHSTRAKIP